MRTAHGMFFNGFDERRVPIGTVRIRTRHKRGGEQRAWVKVAEPNRWRLRAHVVWETTHGPLPRGMSVHHLDENKLNDDPANLKLLTKAEHLSEHRSGFDNASRIANFVKERRRVRWSTKSRTKRTGAPPKWTPAQLHAALADVRAGGTVHGASKKHGVSRTTLQRRIDATG